MSASDRVPAASRRNLRFRLARGTTCCAALRSQDGSPLRPRVFGPAHTRGTSARSQSHARRRADVPAVSNTTCWRASAMGDLHSGSEAGRQFQLSDSENPIRRMENSSGRRVGSRECAAMLFRRGRPVLRPKRGIHRCPRPARGREYRPLEVHGAHSRTRAACFQARGCPVRVRCRIHRPGFGRHSAQRLPPRASLLKIHARRSSAPTIARCAKMNSAA